MSMRSFRAGDHPMRKLHGWSCVYCVLSGFVWQCGAGEQGAELLHPAIDDLGSAPHVVSRLARRPLQGTWQHGGEASGFRPGQGFRGLSEVMAGGRLRAVHAGCPFRDVKIDL